MASSSPRKAIAMSIGWWYLRRLIRKRGAAAVAAFVAGEGLSLAGSARKRHPLRWVAVLAVAAAAGVYWWRSTQQPESTST